RAARARRRPVAGRHGGDCAALAWRGISTAWRRARAARDLAISLRRRDASRELDWAASLYGHLPAGRLSLAARAGWYLGHHWWCRQWADVRRRAPRDLPRLRDVDDHGARAGHPASGA